MTKKKSAKPARVKSGESSLTRSDVRLTALILAGGGGTRLWPLSRRDLPKQFLALDGKRSLLAETFARLQPLVPASRVWVVAGTKFERAIREHLPDLPNPHLVREPAAKNTAPAIGLACAAIAAEDPDAVVAVLPSDHAIAKPEEFRKLLAAAGALAAEQGKLVTLGIVPDRPATGYGYIESGDALGGSAFLVKRFVEKPDAKRAKELVASGRYLWNAGVFVWRASDLLAEIDRHLPELGKGLRDWMRAPEGQRAEIAKRVFDAAPAISIDYAVMEKSDRVAVIPASVGWDDIGTFRSLANMSESGTLARDVISIDAGGNLVHAPGKTVAFIGVDDLIVVDTPDAVLIARRDRAEDVKKVVDELAKRKRDDAL